MATGKNRLRRTNTDRYATRLRVAHWIMEWGKNPLNIQPGRFFGHLAHRYE
jgi:hypothetical protein